ncbi:MAG: pyruvate:ferredoxin (flavodoxin) oxidoreductase [Heliobacteriaceae bacterium]|nr:pyruvate:ferredoxin (flavodoxin) oxidoreductase [Heliobacteriaceae bacterium]
MAKNMKTMDGNKAAAYVSYAFTEVAAIFPITPSSPMAEYADEWSALGQKNIFGQTVNVVEMQSEAGAAGALHGSLCAGALTTSYTASQGLLLMIPNMYKIAGEFLPGVLHVTARSLATHSLNIFGDHSDVMSTVQTGFAMLATNSVQEVMDLGGVAHLAAIKSRIPFLHFFDGFRTSHEQQKIEVIDYADFAKLVDWDAIKAFRENSLNPARPVIRGTNQNPDIFFQAREACNPFFDAVPDIVADYMKQISELTGREYKPFNYYGAPDAERIIVAMGSVCDTIDQVIDFLTAKGEKVGVIKCHLYRPFSAKYFFDVFPESAKKIAVLDRIKTPGATGEPLYADIRNIFYDKDFRPLIVGGRYGLGSKDTTPADIMAVYENLKADAPKNNFTISIVDDVTFTSLPVGDPIDTTPEGTIQCKFWGLGSDGTVGANKQAVEIIGDNTDMSAQAYFAYDSKKSGGVTMSHLRFGKELIKAPYLINTADFISCSNQSYVYNYDLLAGIKDGGTFLLNCVWKPEELDEKLPAGMRRFIAQHNIQFYTINAVDIAAELGLGNRTNMVMQAAFFKLAKVIPVDESIGYLKDSIQKAYGKKGEKIVNMNNASVDKGMTDVVKIDVPAAWANAVDEAAAEIDEPDFVKNVLRPMNRCEGDNLPVSAFTGREDGTFPTATSRFEKRGVSAFVPEWIKENCIQCNQCAYVCPHAAIRPALLNAEEAAKAPATFEAIPAVGKQLAGLSYRMQVSALDCAGCGSCVTCCPAKTKALAMKPIESQNEAQIPNWDFFTTVSIKDNLWNVDTVKGSQFQQPLFEFSGACAGCGETPYLKLLTQFFGDRMLCSNATGCSSIWGAAAPAMPFCVNKEGRGPSWSNSLFEDSAEFGFGLFLGVRAVRNKLASLMQEALAMDISAELKAAFQEWIEGMFDGPASKIASAKVMALLPSQAAGNPVLSEIQAKKDFLVKTSNWAFGGDGWAYDIGYGGVDHVLASNEDINILCYDTEVYSNTGGQSSKSTPTAAIAKFAAAGKRTKKKDLGMMAMSYGYVYVAQIAMGADYAQTLKAIREAEAYKGPSLIIAYSPCINHGLKAGMGKSMTEAKRAVESGYWQLFRYNPDLKQQGKNPFSLDSKEPDFGKFRDFLTGEVRYASLAQLFPEVADELFVKTEEDAKERYGNYKRLAQG